MKKLILSTLVLSLAIGPGCATHVSSTKLLPLPDLIKTGKPRTDPIIKEYPLKNSWETQRACSNVGTNASSSAAYTTAAVVNALLLIWRRGCAIVPIDPNDPCKVIYTQGDEDRRTHEVAHCHGWADEF